MALSPNHPEDCAAVPGEPPKTKDSGIHSINASPACNRCRSRKVKCDRARPVCGGCTRLQLHCSYERRSTSPTPENGNSESYTEAGIKRKRTRLACGACRVRKTKCSGTRPCERCVSKCISCDLITGDDDGAMSIATPKTMISIAPSITALPPDKATARRYLDAYFDSANKTLPTFLHKPSVLADWDKDTLDQHLLKCIMALGLFVSDHRSEARAAAQAWMQEGQDYVLKRIGQQTVAHLKILVILLRFRFHAGNFSDAWSLLAIAARSAFTMRLNYEHDGLDPLVQESNRRLAWAIYQLDRLYSGGMEDLAVCPVERMHIRLPCDERSFEMGIPSKASFLDDVGVEPEANVDAHAFKLRLLAIRDRILRYTKGVRRRGNSPAENRTVMEALQIELNTFERTLPVELKLTPQRLVIMGHSREAGTYAGLHGLWMMCHCDLYRFCVPGLRESVSKDALAQTPLSFIEYCQQACFDTAVRLCGLWSDLYHLESSEYFGDEFLAVSIYQVTQILHHLPHLMPEHGENSGESLKKKLTEALQLAAPLRWVYASVINCLKDTERLVSALGRGSVVRSSPDANPVGGIDTARDHLASKHSVLPHLYRDTEAADNVSGYQASNQRSGKGEASLSYPSKSLSALGREMAEDQIIGPELSDAFLFDPFNMQLNGYYDPELDFSFM
ncbi:fungal-specific transcription factor domain-containing protein [Aspergillus recurvatus]